MDSVAALPSFDGSASSKSAYDRFITYYGTHILDYIEYGAKYIVSTVR